MSFSGYSAHCDHPSSCDWVIYFAYTYRMNSYIHWNRASISLVVERRCELRPGLVEFIHGIIDRYGNLVGHACRVDRIDLFYSTTSLH